MIHEVEINRFFIHPTPLIDVRSPGEFEKGHIPGAINIPLFDNDERAHVGTVYKQKSKEKAIELGYHYVNPKLQHFINAAQKVANSGPVTIHCWRGGMRSHAFAQHLFDNGFPQVSVITGGYKAYRNLLLGTFDIPYQLRIIGGYTGSAKTYIIHELQRLGEQTIDLEGLALHKGSAFGSIGMQPQPTTEQFTNNLFEQWRYLDPQRRIWLEDESMNIGMDQIPLNLFQQMRQSILYFFQIPKNIRASQLVKDYSQGHDEVLEEGIRKISKRLGGLQTELAQKYLQENNYLEVAMIALGYYDKSYLRGVNHRNLDNVITIEALDTNAVNNAQILLKINEQYEHDQANTIQSRSRMRV